MIALIISLTLIIFVFYALEIHPYVTKKIKHRFYMFEPNSSTPTYQKMLLKASLKMAKRETPKMSLADNTYFPIVLVRTLYTLVKNNNRLKNSFPRAFLLNGILDSAFQKGNDAKLFSKVENNVLSFVSQLNTRGRLDYIDQVSMGVVLLKLYQHTAKEDFKLACDKIIDYLKQETNEEGIIMYRKNEGFHYVDVLGMICPFLYLYAHTFQKNDLVSLANKQLLFYLENGMSSSGLPFHAIELSNNMPLGSSNWGRGLGWFLLGLSSSIAYTSINNNPEHERFEEKMKAIKSILDKTKHQHFWGQFIGVSKKWSVDTSVSCMILYSLQVSGYQNGDLSDFYSFIKSKTSKDGLVDFTSGDTEDINVYSREFGNSELTQGLLLSILTQPHKFES